MAILTANPYATRSTVTLSSAEIWQVSGGAVRLQTSAPTDEGDGIRMGVNDTAIRFASGQSVTVWRDGNVGAQIIRMAVL